MVIDATRENSVESKIVNNLVTDEDEAIDIRVPFSITNALKQYIMENINSDTPIKFSEVFNDWFHEVYLDQRAYESDSSGSTSSSSSTSNNPKTSSDTEDSYLNQQLDNDYFQKSNMDYDAMYGSSSVKKDDKSGKTDTTPETEDKLTAKEVSCQKSHENKEK